MNKPWFDESLSDAVDDPRLHEELVPMDVEIEKKYRLNGDIVKGLEKLGHNVKVGKDADFAVVQAIYRKPGKGIYAKSDPRKYGVPAGVSSATSCWATFVVWSNVLAIFWQLKTYSAF